MAANFEHSKKSLKKSLFVGVKKFFPGNVTTRRVELDEKIKKIRYGHFKSKNSKKNNFAGGLEP